MQPLRQNCDAGRVESQIEATNTLEPKCRKTRKHEHTHDGSNTYQGRPLRNNQTATNDLRQSPALHNRGCGPKLRQERCPVWSSGRCCLQALLWVQPAPLRCFGAGWPHTRKQEGGRKIVPGEGKRQQHQKKAVESGSVVKTTCHYL